jgi:hypothetical protein
MQSTIDSIEDKVKQHIEILKAYNMSMLPFDHYVMLATLSKEYEESKSYRCIYVTYDDIRSDMINYFFYALDEIVKLLNSSDVIEDKLNLIKLIFESEYNSVFIVGSKRIFKVSNMPTYTEIEKVMDNIPLLVKETIVINKQINEYLELFIKTITETSNKIMSAKSIPGYVNIQTLSDKQNGSCFQFNINYYNNGKRISRPLIYKFNLSNKDRCDQALLRLEHKIKKGFEINIIPYIKESKNG